MINEISCRHPAMPIENGKIQDLLRQLAVIETVLVLLPFPNVGGVAHVRQADLGNQLPIFDAGREQDGLVQAVVPNPKGIPSGGAAAPIQIKTRSPAVVGGNLALGAENRTGGKQGPLQLLASIPNQTDQGSRGHHSMPETVMRKKQDGWKNH
ncbi:hypothetical protein E2320_007506 [Naja naja]|nr:hypothetical protein E2320_007506 [Naja naja]